MDVGLELGDVADVHLLPRRGHHLHDADRADVALCVRIETRLLVALRRHQHPVHVVPAAVTAEQRHERDEALARAIGRGPLTYCVLSR
jgi:hypothetical protein